METPIFDKASLADWITRAERDLKGKAISELDFELAGTSYPPFHVATPELHYPPVPGMPSGHRLVGIEIDARKDLKKANAIALDALSKGADLLIFRVPYLEAFTKGQRKALLKGIIKDIITIIYAEALFDAPGAPVLFQEGSQYHVDALTGDYADALYGAMESYVEDAVKTPCFHLRSQPNYLLSIAELRALRLCWARISEACGERTDCRIIGHVQFPAGSDAHQNKIAASTQALSLVVGGANGLVVAASDTADATNFSRRVALNLQHLLEHESHVANVPDPAAGSYFLEKLTDDRARAIWAKFQRLTTDPSYNI